MKRSQLKQIIQEEIAKLAAPGTLNEGVESLSNYYKNWDKSIRDRSKKIDDILNKEIQSDSVKKDLLDLITDFVDEYTYERGNY